MVATGGTVTVTSAGVASPVSVPLAAGGVVVVGHGLVTTSTAMQNLIAGDYSHPDSQRTLPKKSNGEPDPHADGATGAHTQLGKKNGSKGTYKQAREFDSNGKLIKDIDFTNHGRPKTHPNPHQHSWECNPAGGTPKRSKKADVLKNYIESNGKQY